MSRGNSARGARGRGTNLRRNAVGIDAEKLMHAEGTDVGQTQGRVVRQLLLDGKIPFLNGRSFRIRLYSLWRKGSAGGGRARAARRERGTWLEGDKRKQRSRCSSCGWRDCDRGRAE